MPSKRSRRGRTHSVSDLSIDDTGPAADGLSASSSLQPQPSCSSQPANNQVGNGINNNKKRKHDQLSSKPFTNNDDTTIDAIAEVHVLISDQKAEILQLREIVGKQQRQIDSLLSMLGITPTPTVAVASSSVPVGPSSSQPPRKVPAAASAHSYAATVGNAPALPAPLKQAVVVAVYRDLQEHDKRARNIVLSGMKAAADDQQDSHLASDLLEAEFGFKPTIEKCRRLGKKQPLRIQPLLLTLSTAKEASYYVTEAKRLRQSDNEHIRRSVYINRDVTKAEAQAAYISRCERRQRAADWQKRQAGASSTSQPMPPPPSSSPSILGGTAMDDLAPSGSSSSNLNVLSNEFIPRNAPPVASPVSTNTMTVSIPSVAVNGHVPNPPAVGQSAN